MHEAEISFKISAYYSFFTWNNHRPYAEYARLINIHYTDFTLYMYITQMEDVLKVS